MVSSAFVNEKFGKELFFLTIFSYNFTRVATRVKYLI